MRPLITISFIICFVNSWGQSLNWLEQTIAPQGENLKEMSKADDGTSTIVGHGNTIVQSNDNGTTWHDIGIFTNADTYNYTDISFSGETGYIVAASTFKAVNRVQNDLTTAAPILKTIDGGATWTILPLDNMGIGDDASINPSLLGNSSHRFYAVKCINEQTAFIAAYWKDINAITHYNVLATIDGGDTWGAILPDNLSKTITSIEVYRNTLYIAGASTLYKICLDRLKVENLHEQIDSDDSEKIVFSNINIYDNTIYFPTYSDGIYFTRNNGNSFEKILNIDNGCMIHRHNEHTFVALGKTSSTQATLDGGMTWLDCSVGETLWNGEVVGDSLVALGKGRIYKMALSDIEEGIFNWYKTDIPQSSSNLKTIWTNDYTTYIVGNDDCILRSQDNASTFIPVTIPSKREIIYESLDLEINSVSQGKDKSSIITSRRYKYIDYPAGGLDDQYLPGIILITNDNWVNYTVLDDTKVKDKVNDSPAYNPNAKGCYAQDYFTSECINDSTFYVYCQWYDTITTEERVTHGNVFKTTDRGENWNAITSDLGSNFVTTIDFNDKRGYIAGKNTFLKVSTNDDSVIDLYPKLTALSDESIYINDIKIINDQKVLVTSMADGIFISDNAGTSFNKLNNISGSNSTIVLDNTILALGGSTKSYLSKDNGDTWTSCYPGSTIYKGGEVLGDTLFVLSKTVAYKIALKDIDTTINSNRSNTQEESTVKVWQNKNELNILSSNKIDICRVYSSNGQLVGNYSVNNDYFSINTQKFSTGIYLLSTQSEGKQYTQKVIIK